MAFTRSSLTAVSATGAGVKLWLYSTADNNADIDTAGYFNGASSILKVGDVIISSTGDGFSITKVNANSGGVVDVSDGTAAGATDTD